MFPFLFLSIALFILWLLFFFFSKETRFEQLIMSVLGLILSPSLLLIASTQFRATISEIPLSIGIEDFLFSFSLFGIAAIIYHIFCGKHLHSWKGDRLRLKNPLFHFFAHLILILGVWICIAFASMLAFDFSIYQSLMLGGLLIALYVVIDRHDLFIDAILSGLLTAVMVFILQQLFFIRLFPVSSLWDPQTIFSMVIDRIHLEQILWAIIVGFAIGPMYEWLRRFRLK